MTPDERKAAIEATATERSATQNPPVVHQTLADLHKRVAELEGKSVSGDPSNDFHVKSNALHDQHGEARAKFVENLIRASIVEETFIPLFLEYLNEYESAGVDVRPSEEKVNG